MSVRTSIFDMRFAPKKIGTKIGAKMGAKIGAKMGAKMGAKNLTEIFDVTTIFNTFLTKYFSKSVKFPEFVRNLSEMLTID